MVAKSFCFKKCIKDSDVEPTINIEFLRAEIKKKELVNPTAGKISITKPAKKTRTHLATQRCILHNEEFAHVRSSG